MDLLEIGTKLEAIDVCEMYRDGEPTGNFALTVGKEYEITEVKYVSAFERSYVVIDDDNDEHQYDVDGYEKYFKIKV